MGIPNNQLETWANPVQHISAMKSHESIRNALALRNWQGSLIDVYLQGSYRNHTNVRGSSDVDVVVQYDRPGYWEAFRQDVLNDLRRSYGTVEEGNKSIKVRAGSFDADVIVCEKLSGSVEGIRFYTHRQYPRREIKNYPKLHIRNGEIKNQNTDEVYKPTVRIFKNMRNWLIERGRLNAKTAPSYFVECLLYNVPDSNFINVCDCTVLNVLNWLHQNGVRGDLSCQNGQTYLYGNAPEQWSQDRASQYINALIGMWNNWGS
ncbi:MAG: nucleotidyltransferase [Anaerolineaceae bacterium]|nr:nucleotidyltransferase [Anaerolineaceae bacterium]